MIETQFFILEPKLYNECIAEAATEGVTLDYYLLEFCNVEGDWIEVES